MCPASTRPPPKRLTPRRLEWESRPFLVLPPAFLCAMAALTPAQYGGIRGGSAEDSGDLHFGVGLAVTLLAQVVLATAEFDDPHLVALTVGLHGGGDLGTGEIGLADLDVA